MDKAMNWKIYAIPPVLFISIFIFATSLMPLSGYALIFLLLFIWFVSMCVTFVGLHKLLQYNEPIPFICLQDYFQYLGYGKKTTPNERKVIKSNSEAVKRLTNDLDRFYISKWYKHISKDENFPSESKVFLEEVLTRVIDVQLQINNKQIVNGTLNIFLKHLKEFRRSVKRKEKYHGCLEDLYRYSHICSTLTIKKPKEYFLHQLTTDLLRHFVNSELWNSLPCHILVSILARKCISYLLDVLSNPEVVNYLILITLCSDETKNRLKLNDYGRISLVDFYKDSELKQEVNKGTGDIDTESIKNASETLGDAVQEKDSSRKISLDNSKPDKNDEKTSLDNKVILRTRLSQAEPDSVVQIERSPKRNNPVKIYEPKSTSKTWRDSRDLACISLGQDPLDSLPVGTDIMKTSKPNFWESTVKNEESKQDSPTSAAQIFNEVMNIRSMEGLKSSIKPISDVTERTLHNIKDLQETTVHNALHKIGDFQDEAAGVVEGILDFGRAGFRKGLRLTGLQDNIENAKATVTNIQMAKPVQRSVKEQVRRKLEELRRSDSESLDKFSSAESVESVWINPLESPICEEPVIYEQPEQILMSSTRAVVNENISIPSISMEQPVETDSPDPEYEDTADLASSIAKLRSLLQQRSSESNISTPALSPMPDEYFQKHAESENVSDVEALEVDGMMPNFYKFCAKTASGVLSNTLNTIKTALPGNNSGHIYTVEKWKFKLESKESDTLSRMKKLLTERKEYCILDKEIDTGYDALDTVDIFQHTPVMLSNVQFDDELDDFEGKMPITKTLLDIFCELLADTNTPLIQEPVIKGVLLSCGSLMERNIEEQIQQTVEYLAENLVAIPEESNTNVLSMDLNEYVEAIRSSFPDSLKYIIRKDTINNAIKLLTSSLQIKKINEDILLQVFELIAMKLIETAQTSPPASA